MNREEAIKRIRDFGLYHAIEDLLHSTKTVEAFEMAIQALEEPERKKGEWLDNETSYLDDIPQTCTCSVCGLRSRRPVGDFCKWCGADMREDTEDGRNI